MQPGTTATECTIRLRPGWAIILIQPRLLRKGQNVERLKPVKMRGDPAPASLLKLIKCNCHSKGDKNSCFCHKNGLLCSLACGHCKESRASRRSRRLIDLICSRCRYLHRYQRLVISIIKIEFLDTGNISLDTSFVFLALKAKKLCTF